MVRNPDGADWSRIYPQPALSLVPSCRVFGSIFHRILIRVCASFDYRLPTLSGHALSGSVSTHRWNIDIQLYIKGVALTLSFLPSSSSRSSLGHIDSIV